MDSKKVDTNTPHNVLILQCLSLLVHSDFSVVDTNTKRGRYQHALDRYFLTYTEGHGQGAETRRRSYPTSIQFEYQQIMLIKWGIDSAIADENRRLKNLARRTPTTNIT